jgi:ribosome-binding factor A
MLKRTPGMCPHDQTVPARMRVRGRDWQTCVFMGKSRRDSGDKAKHERQSECCRTMRQQELIREEVNFLLRCEVTDARLQRVGVTFVELTTDGSCARLWFTADGEEDRTAALERAAGFIRNHLAESLALKRTPELRFRRDPTSRTPAPRAEEP